MKIALCGLPFSGKSTVFKALMGKQTQPKTSGSGKMQLNIGTLEVRDQRLEKLAQLLDSKKTTYPKINLIDLAQPGEKSAKGMDAAQLKEFDALGLVIAAFSSEDLLGDLKNIQAELVLADMQLLQNRIERIHKERKGRPQKEEDPELVLVKRCEQALGEENAIKQLGLGPEELKMLAGFQLLTLKPAIVIANLSEEQLAKEVSVELEKGVQAMGLSLLAFCAKLEAEIEELPEQERPQFLKEMGIQELGREKFIQLCLKAQELISFFTVVGKEARAWPIPKGTSALGAAGSVHSDMERGFIRAEVINYQDFVQCGTFVQAKERGLLRLESKEYAVQDGDIINFKFSV